MGEACLTAWSRLMSPTAFITFGRAAAAKPPARLLPVKCNPSLLRPLAGSGAKFAVSPHVGLGAGWGRAPNVTATGTAVGGTAVGCWLGCTAVGGTAVGCWLGCTAVGGTAVGCWLGCTAVGGTAVGCWLGCTAVGGTAVGGIGVSVTGALVMPTVGSAGKVGGGA